MAANRPRPIAPDSLVCFGVAVPFGLARVCVEHGWEAGTDWDLEIEHTLSTPRHLRARHSLGQSRHFKTRVNLETTQEQSLTLCTLLVRAAAAGETPPQAGSSS